MFDWLKHIFKLKQRYETQRGEDGKYQPLRSNEHEVKEVVPVAEDTDPHEAERAKPKLRVSGEEAAAEYWMRKYREAKKK